MAHQNLQQRKGVLNLYGQKKTEFGKIIHADLCCPMETPSIGGSKTLTLTFILSLFLKHKNEVKEKFKVFTAWFKNQRGEMFKTLHTDCGTEFVNRAIQQLLSELGVVYERSVPYCPEQSGRIEREMCKIAVNTAVYVLNRTGTSRVEGKTPYQLWEGKDYDITLLKVFGL
ncbi:hypothetical protein PR048_020835 [Dryococelus australis]|uniref:Integrase catalytic domain-containing protein n=1 Tax=Dryococelus australis TaxID=614101 RepID=A0ABQ9GWI5_9NEOP|nr:hypothetical protein PR048_020835 [Dryococelus australis]